MPTKEERANEERFSVQAERLSNSLKKIDEQEKAWKQKQGEQDA